MGTNPKKPMVRARRYALTALGLIAGAGGVAGNIGSIVDLYDKITGHPSSSAASVIVPNTSVEGPWRAEVTYDWGARQTELLLLKQTDAMVRGTVSFLGHPRGILEGKVEGDRLSLVLKRHESMGEGPPLEVRHEYTGTVVNDTIRFVLQITGGHAGHEPVEFTATKIVQ